MYPTIQRIVKVPKFYLTCKLKPRKGLRICTSSLTTGCHGRPATRRSKSYSLHTELISRYTDPENYGAQYTGKQYLPVFPAFPRVLLNARSNRINVIVSICSTSQNKYRLSSSSH